MSSERIWMLAFDAWEAVEDARHDLYALAQHPSIPTDVVSGRDWRSLAGDINVAARRLAAIACLASDFRADGEPVDIGEGD